ncbi:MAG: hypothetical protein MJ099_00425 [Clostridia bacterium]|nr:hypothetical protein [Clostridia bacterium]
MERYLIGIDVGTTGTKSMVVSEHGEIVGHAYRGYPIATPKPGYNEQNALDWWDAIVETVTKATADIKDKSAIAAISLSAQGGTFLPVDEKGEPVRPAIVWSDKRCAEQRAKCDAAVGAANVFRTCGWRLGNGLVALDIAWLKDNEPENFAKTKQFLSVPDYVSLKLTGKAVIDISDAGINELADIENGCYYKPMLDFLGIEESMLPEIVPSGTVIGHLTAEAAKLLNLTESTVLVSGAHDQYAGLLGAGIMVPGDIMIGTGTAWVITALTDAPDYSTGFSHSISATGKWGQLTSMTTGGVCLDWLRKNILNGDNGPLDYGVINEEASKRAVDKGGLRFFPYFSGAMFPLSDPAYKGTFVGLDLSHDKFDMVRAVMEGVAFQTAWMLEGFRAKSPLHDLILTGGAAKSPFWVQMVADIVNYPVITLSVTDLTCVGAAIMAGVGTGVFADYEAGQKVLNTGKKVYTPDPENAAKYAPEFARYKKDAAALQTVYED